MTTARKLQISLESTSNYHVISRCVRRAFLYGEDHFTGKNFDHRKQWVIDRLTFLSSLFAIDICAYAVMSNHTHLILHVDSQSATAWTNQDIIERWGKLFPGCIASRSNSETRTPRELEAISLQVTLWRERLTDISWFMRCLNEWLARKANKEDQCTGRFWEGRFKSQALLDEGALLACMVYVDLNPVRAGIANTLEDSDFTSIQARIQQYHAQQQEEKPVEEQEEIALMPCYDGRAAQESPHLPISFQDYQALAEWTGRAIREDKKGAIPDRLASLLDEANLNHEHWLPVVQEFERCFTRVVGSVSKIDAAKERLGKQWLQGVGMAKQIYKAA